MATRARFHQAVHLLQLRSQHIHISPAPDLVSSNMGLNLLDVNDEIFTKDLDLMEHDQFVNALRRPGYIDRSDHASAQEYGEQQAEAR